MQKFRVYATIEVEALDSVEAAMEVFDAISEYEYGDFMKVNVTRVEELTDNGE